MVFEISLEVGDALRLKVRVKLAHAARIHLPERDRHKMHQLAVPRFACHQKGVGSVVVGSTVHGRENMIGLLAAAGSPDAKDGIAQYPVGGQLARRGSVSFGDRKSTRLNSSH